MRWFLPVLAILLSTAAVRGGVEEGAASFTPWSGYWWPLRKGELIASLKRYDQLTGAQSAAWEFQHKRPGPQQMDWAGYCHAWSASALLEKEPKQPRQLQVTLGVGDQKGFLAAAHARDVANVYGDRYGDGRGREDLQDLYPDVLWHYLKLYVKQQGIPLVMDLEPGPEVWNYPVYAYRIEYGPQGDGGQQLARLSLWAADDHVPPDYVGTKVHYEVYQFTFQLRDGNCVAGSARWVGASQRKHPDFAWYPYVVRPENPHIKYKTVLELLATTPGPEITQPQPQPGQPQPGQPQPGQPQPGQPQPGQPQPGQPQPGQPQPQPGQPQPQPGQPQPQPGQPVVPQPVVPPPVTPPGSPPGMPPQQPGQIGDGRLPISPGQLLALIENRKSSFMLDVTVDRFDGGQYQAGAPFRVRGSSERNGYLYLIHFDSRGELVRLLTGRPGNEYTVAAGQAFEVGPYAAIGAPGTHRVKALVSERRLAFTGLDESTAFPDGTRRFAWVPSQQELAAQFLRQYSAGQGGGMLLQQATYTPEQFLGPFAQDEVMFYVEPPAGGPPR